MGKVGAACVVAARPVQISKLDVTIHAIESPTVSKHQQTLAIAEDEKSTVTTHKTAEEVPTFSLFCSSYVETSKKYRNSFLTVQLSCSCESCCPIALIFTDKLGCEYPVVLFGFERGNFFGFRRGCVMEGELACSE